MVIGAESRLKQNCKKGKTNELRAEEDSTTHMKEATRKLIELARNKTKVEGMRCDVEIKQYSAHLLTFVWYIFAA